MILMRDGQIAEHGSHTQLMAKARDYAALFNGMQQEVRPAPLGSATAFFFLFLNKASLPSPHNNIEHYMLNNALAPERQAQ